MKRVGFFGGSFNPVHLGHTGLALWIKEHCGLDEVWLSLSPANPLKPTVQQGADNNERLAMLRLALEGENGLRAWDGELTMPRPSYTVNVLRALRSQHPDISFSLIIGADNWAEFTHWRNPDEIMRYHEILVYPRPGVCPGQMAGGATYLVDAPQCDANSTDIRTDTANCMHMLAPKVAEYIKQHRLYGYSQQ